jgi:hypothetical protein
MKAMRVALPRVKIANKWPRRRASAPGVNGSVAYADIDSGVAVAVMRNRFDADPTAVTAIDRIVKRDLRRRRWRT